MSEFKVSVGETGVSGKKLTANVVDTIVFEGDPDSIRVVNEDGAGALDYTINGPTPTVGGNQCERLPAAISAEKHELKRGAPHTIKLISATAVTYGVRAVSE